MPTKLQRKMLGLLDSNIGMKKKYLQLAVFLSNHGIRPPLSETLKATEKAWIEQNDDCPSRNPYLYLQADNSIALQFQDVLTRIDKHANILEVGCNAGRILNYLNSKGYNSLTGIEIGSKAEKVMQEHFPEAYSVTTFITGHAYDELKRLPTSYYDLVYCKGVLVNIAPKYNSIFKEMARVSKSYILIAENEGSYNAYPRDFEKMFKKAGYKQILHRFYARRASDKREVIFPSFCTTHDIFKNLSVRVFVPVK